MSLRVSIGFNTAADAFIFSFQDSNFNELDRADNVSFANTASYIDTALLSWSGVPPSNAYADGLRIQQFLSPDPSTAVGDEESL